MPCPTLLQPWGPCRGGSHSTQQSQCRASRRCTSQGSAMVVLTCDLVLPAGPLSVAIVEIVPWWFSRVGFHVTETSANRPANSRRFCGFLGVCPGR
jgi:hypothetical protein